jgi:hypothetical protein
VTALQLRILRLLVEKGPQRTIQGLGLGVSKQLPKLRFLGVTAEYVLDGQRHWGITPRGRTRLEKQQPNGHVEFVLEQRAKQKAKSAKRKQYEEKIEADIHRRHNEIRQSRHEEAEL